MFPFSKRYFNPRSREGSDNKCDRCNRHCIYFNPRSREGSDQNQRESKNSAVISIHAPAKGATTDPSGLRIVCKFQSTLPRRERRITSRLEPTEQKFQSTLPRRERLTSTQISSSSLIFQSTLPRRERLMDIISQTSH